MSRQAAPSPENQRQQIKRNEKTLLVLMDSNRRHIDKNLLWRGSSIQPCATIHQAIEKIKSIEDHPNAILIHTGVNDIESSSADEVYKSLEILIKTCWDTLPDTHIILSEITPRMDMLDRDVFKVNKFLHQNFENDVTIIKHHSLQNQNLMKDNKHVNEYEGTTKLAGNLKFGIRRAFGIERQNNLQSKRPEYGYRTGQANRTERRPMNSWDPNIITTNERSRATVATCLPEKQFEEVRNKSDLNDIKDLLLTLISSQQTFQKPAVYQQKTF